ncbi:tetratricopeptide repeat protein [Verrucomicrobiaceae bacterium N1E253]|uniref:Tetratricopeptide repeat protein n=1 Tax=Oceaniferula marina TaxID=2748318 RepID=A0A851GQM4_9BACT|nr:tetratricopeptide repeat protein [Oceaniferula marina]NWK57120.1 tetratricopeptide repeat protein [Oceaniferula marina]
MSEESNPPTELTEAQLSSDIKALWLKAQSAFEQRNFTYAIKLCLVVLKDTPGFLDARRLARNSAAADTAGSKKKKGLFGMGGGGVSSVTLMKIQNQGKKDPMAALGALEEELAKAPFDGGANDLLFDNAMRLNMLDTAAFALETVRSGAPENTKLLHKLAEHYLARDEPDKAADVYNDIVKQDVTDMDAVKGSKDATARASMKKQKWEEAESFRDVMRSGDDAAELESANRAAMTRDQMMEKLARLSEDYAGDNQNLALVKEIADLYEQLEDWPNAYSFFQYAFELSQKDVALQNKAAYMKDKAAEYQITQLREACAADPDNEELRQQYEALVSDRTSEQVSEAQERVDRNPTDPQLRYELGLALYNAGDFSAAIPHLQQATRNPHIRTRVLLLLGRTFKAKNMYDLAIKQLSDALEDLLSMDGTKKEVLYEKGLIHEETGDASAALDSFKQIYEVDYGYRDVAQRVEQSYTG